METIVINDVISHHGDEDRAGSRAESDGDHEDADSEADELDAVHIVLFPAPEHFADLQQLVPEEDEERADLLEGPEGGPADDWDLDGADGADDEEDRVRLVDALVDPAHDRHDEGVDADHVDHEHVPAPRSDHVNVPSKCLN